MICMHGDKKKAAHAGAAIQKGSSEMELVHQSSTSPFDSIRQVAEDGTERGQCGSLCRFSGTSSGEDSRTRLIERRWRLQTRG